jgi:hypothetical protein
MKPSSAGPLGASIRIFLVSGSPEGFRIVEKSNWTGVAAVTSRSEYPVVRIREEFGRPGVYVLSGPSESGAPLPRIYIGEADKPRKRLDKHLSEKDFWTQAIVFSTKGGGLNKAHTRYLESRLIQLAYQAKRAEVENGNAPQLPPLSEPDKADAESFLQDMLILFPLIQVTAFEVASDPVPAGGRLSLEGPGANAEGKETSEGFLVYGGSIARLQPVPSIHGWLVQIRDKLLEQGILAEEDDGLKFTQDYVFNSPSSAAGVVLGRAANGRTEWRDKEGRNLKELAKLAVPG